MVKSISENVIDDVSKDKDENTEDHVVNVNNVVKVILIGTYREKYGTKSDYFTRSILALPDIDSDCYLIEENNLENFISV